MLRSHAQDLAQKLYSTNSVSSSARFQRPKLSQTAFTIQHYAGPVTYQTDNFLDKNKDFVVAEHQQLLQDSTTPFVRELFAPDTVSSKGLQPALPAWHALSHSLPSALLLQHARPATVRPVPQHVVQQGYTRIVARSYLALCDFAVSCSHLQPADDGDGTPAKAAPRAAFKFNSVGSQFKKQLGELMSQLLTMEPHYVRCVKPNGLNQPGLFENSNALHQLRCGGEHRLRTTSIAVLCLHVNASAVTTHVLPAGRKMTLPRGASCC